MNSSTPPAATMRRNQLGADAVTACPFVVADLPRGADVADPSEMAEVARPVARGWMLRESSPEADVVDETEATNVTHGMAGVNRSR